MVRPGDHQLYQQLEARLRSFDGPGHALPGIHDDARFNTLLEQMIESIRRVRYVSVIREREISGRRADPNDELFDPLKAAIFFQRGGQTDEAFWMVFLFVHFGKHSQSGWRYAREVYGRLGGSDRWGWANTSADTIGFRAWLHARQQDLKQAGGLGGFGNHRKYQSLDAYSKTGTGAAVESYVTWVRPPRTHDELIRQAWQKARPDRREAFDELYRSMEAIASFGRTARFDYLTMVGKLGLAPIEPGSTYMQGSTGPLAGARLLFGVQEKPAKLDQRLIELDDHLSVGMQVLEDALCNWQKSPGKFKPFRT